MMLALRALFALVFGYFAGWIVSVGIVFRYAEAAGMIDRDGGLAMGAFFIVGPFCGLLTALALTAWTLFAGLRRRRLAAAGQAEPPPSAGWRIAKGVVCATAGYLAVWFGLEFFGPYQLGPAAKLLVTEGIPLAAGVVAGFFAARRL